MSDRWVPARREAFVRDFVRDYCQVFLILAEQARRFTNIEVYFPIHLAKEEPEGEYSWSYFIGFDVKDVNHGDLGVIEHVDDSTMNVLFVIRRGDDEILVPAHEEFIVELNHEERFMLLDLPDGLLNLDSLDD